MLQRPALVEAVGHRQRLAVVGDRQVLESGRARRAGHGLEIVLAVGDVGVAVQVAAKILARDEGGQRLLRGGFDLAAVLPQFRRDPRQAERGVDAFLGGAGHHHAIGQPGQAVLVEAQTQGDRAVA